MFGGRAGKAIKNPKIATRLFKDRDIFTPFITKHMMY